jgi:murein DD-endopeptidase MepM/ murein hydrolase activator NlpD
MGTGRGPTGLIIAAVALVMLVPSGGCPAELSVTPDEVIPGGIARVTLSGACEHPEGNIDGQALRFFRTGSEGRAISLIGIDLDAPQGERVVAVRCNGWAGRTGLLVGGHEFPKEELTVADQYVRPNPAEQARAAQEAKRLDRLWAAVSPERLWRGEFQRPAQGPLGTAFGLRRIFNGQPRSPHTGIDIRAKRGTPVVAANTGCVVLRNDLFFSGNTVVLDHGLGLYTAYLHLSEYRVSDDELVEKGQVIGLVGATGRATGPHLHFSARLGGARVDPWQLITEDFEGSAASAESSGDSADDVACVRVGPRSCKRGRAETRK